jgi:hypothetical protein
MKVGAASSAKKPKTNAERVSYIAGDYIATCDEQKPPQLRAVRISATLMVS